MATFAFWNRQLGHSHLDSQVIHNNTVKGRGEGRLQLEAALPFGQDGAQGQAIAKGKFGLPAAIQGESGPQLCKHVAVTKPATAYNGDMITRVCSCSQASVPFCRKLCFGWWRGDVLQQSIAWPWQDTYLNLLRRLPTIKIGKNGVLL